MHSQPLFWTAVVVVAGLMEPWSMWVHRRLWHGSLWWGHESHHTARTGRFELNDVFAAVHAPIAMALIIGGFELGTSVFHTAMVAVGYGMSAFGLAYVLVHDGFIHGRLPLQWLARFRYFRLIRNAHDAHHARDDAPPFGLFLGPQELAWYRGRNRARRINAAR